MLSLTRPQRHEVSLDGRRFKLRLSFDRVLLVYELMADPEPDDGLKLEIALQILVSGRRWKRLAQEDQHRLLSVIFSEHIQTDKRPSEGGPKVMDYTEDAAYIFASFRSAYGIDLLRERGRMSWAEFSALMDGLPDNTKLREVVRIRAAEVPMPDKHNAKSREALLKAKRFYALKAAQVSYQQGLEALFAFAKSVSRS
ncbi:MAG: Gp15 family bacteriophage protein [Bacillota bacterium]|nr:Gp15 family bacteriophage protein [Bacillota bacterium]